MKKESNKDSYVYVFLNPLKPGKWKYKDFEFEFQPFYVGRGVGNRLKSHFCPYNLNRNSIKCSIIRKIIKETGFKPPHIKLYENISVEESELEETSFIKYFGRIDLKTGILSNLTDGGKGGFNKIERHKKINNISNKSSRMYTSSSRRIDQYDMNGNFIKKWDSARDIEIGLNLSNYSGCSVIIACCLGKRKSSKGFIWKFDGTSPYIRKHIPRKVFKMVYQYSLNGDYVASFNNCDEAGRSLNKINGATIRLCCYNKIRFAYNFRWFFEFKGLKIDALHNLKTKRVECFDEKMNFVKCYESISAATRETGAKPSNIIRCCVQTHRIAKGFYWRYTD